MCTESEVECGFEMDKRLAPSRYCPRGFMQAAIIGTGAYAQNRTRVKSKRLAKVMPGPVPAVRDCCCRSFDYCFYHVMRCMRWLGSSCTQAAPPSGPDHPIAPSQAAPPLSIITGTSPTSASLASAATANRPPRPPRLQCLTRGCTHPVNELCEGYCAACYRAQLIANSPKSGSPSLATAQAAAARPARVSEADPSAGADEDDIELELVDE